MLIYLKNNKLSVNSWEIRILYAIMLLAILLEI